MQPIKEFKQTTKNKRVHEKVRKREVLRLMQRPVVYRWRVLGVVWNCHTPRLVTFQRDTQGLLARTGEGGAQGDWGARG